MRTGRRRGTCRLLGLPAQSWEARHRVPAVPGTGLREGMPAVLEPSDLASLLAGRRRRTSITKLAAECFADGLVGRGGQWLGGHRLPLLQPSRHRSSRARSRLRLRVALHRCSTTSATWTRSTTSSSSDGLWQEARAGYVRSARSFCIDRQRGRRRQRRWLVDSRLRPGSSSWWDMWDHRRRGELAPATLKLRAYVACLPQMQGGCRLRALMVMGLAGFVLYYVSR